MGTKYTIKFVVFENLEPCTHEHFLINGCGWENCEFNSFDEAKKYARKWIKAMSGNNIPNKWDGSNHDYSGRGNIISILTVVERFDAVDVNEILHLRSRVAELETKISYLREKVYGQSQQYIDKYENEYFAKQKRYDDYIARQRRYYY